MECHPAINSTSGVRGLGRKGEELAARLLKRHGYHLVVSNFTVPIGRNSRGAQVTGEIDIIAIDGDTLCFIEVKTRSYEHIAAPSAAVDLRKQRQIIRAGKVYRRIFNIRDIPVRYDVVSVIMQPGKRPAIDIAKNFWTEAKFRKRTWADEFYGNFGAVWS
jgi:putative endonuclease